jgi:phage baseplate assembly protein W
MPIYVGFSTQHVENVRTAGFTRGINNTISNTDKVQRSGKKFRTVDEQLVIQDLINSFNIAQGQKPGRPDYGTTLWSYVFEPNTVDVRKQLEYEISRIIELEPRIILNTLKTTNMESGIMIQLELAVTPFNNPTELAILFDQGTRTARVV